MSDIISMRLFHTGFYEIPSPDLGRGRRNADFGQGFYLSSSDEFAGKWAKERVGQTVYVNSYELDLEGLSVLRLERDRAWFDYIFRNRRAQRDIHGDADVIIGPIANDTIYDTLGIITSGFLSEEESLALLMVGPCFQQIAIKTQKAASQLRWLGSRVLDMENVAELRRQLEEDEKAYLGALVQEMERLNQEPKSDIL